MFNKYGVEKYDAFDDVGGKLSFALALLDKENTGLILNAVHSRDNCFLYMKEIVKTHAKRGEKIMAKKLIIKNLFY